MCDTKRAFAYFHKMRQNANCVLSLNYAPKAGCVRALDPRSFCLLFIHSGERHVRLAFLSLSIRAILPMPVFHLNARYDKCVMLNESHDEKRGMKNLPCFVLGGVFVWALQKGWKI